MTIYDVVSGKYSPRYVLALLERLPAEASFITAIRGGEEYLGWDRHAYMLADLFDAVQTLTHIYTKSHAKKAPKEPDPYPRPGVDASKKRTLPNPLIAALKGEEVVMEVGPGSRIPLPPRKN